MPLDATVVICTHRPGQELVCTLGVVAPQVAQRAELLVVRSGADASSPVPEALRGWMIRHPCPVRVLNEPRAGIAAARQRGLDEAASDVVVYIDDDVRPRPGWLDALLGVVTDDVAAAGGTIVPVWPSGIRPRWLPARLASFYGERGTSRDSHHPPFGANMAVRRSKACEVGGFRLDLGHSGTAPGLHEETELCTRLAAAGYVVAEAASAVVDHRVRDDQVNVRWVMRRAAAEGSSDARRDDTHGNAVIRLVKLAGLIAVCPFAVVRTRALVYVAARIVSNAGYLDERARLRLRWMMKRRGRDAHARARAIRERRPTR